MKTENLELHLYDPSENFAITAEENSLNHNMIVIDNAIGKKPGEKIGDGEIFNDYENNEALLIGSHAEGVETKAHGACSHAQGEKTKAYGACSHAGGFDSIAQKDRSFVHGENLEAIAKNQFVVGSSNDPDNNAIFIVGDGKKYSEENWLKRNAFVVKTDGSAILRTQGEDDTSIIIKKTLTNALSTKLDTSLIQMGTKIPNDTAPRGTIYF